MTRNIQTAPDSGIALAAQMGLQLKKGVLELCVLSLLSRKDCYGFELVGAVSRGVAMSEGTVYPLLKRLKEDALLTTYLAESSEGPPRKYYRITAQGKERVVEMVTVWQSFRDGVDSILAGTNIPDGSGGAAP